MFFRIKSIHKFKEAFRSGMLFWRTTFETSPTIIPVSIEATEKGKKQPFSVASKYLVCFLSDIITSLLNW
jgi:hypothetical protein